MLAKKNLENANKLAGYLEPTLQPVEGDSALEWQKIIQKDGLATQKEVLIEITESINSMKAPGYKI